VLQVAVSGGEVKVFDVPAPVGKVIDRVSSHGTSLIAGNGTDVNGTLGTAVALG
jgi:hypothetical protein